ncbi:transglycosylase domain-containing protein, partial [Candidatus Gracilibacteria bacterium]|nr:transglycosylase domain-containing protein [Candidatus Gracilibacteria bacterium]
MKKIIITILCFSFVGLLFFVGNIWIKINKGPNTSYGHLLLTDNKNRVIADKGRSGGYALPYNQSLDTELVKNILEIEDVRFYGHNGVNIQAKIASFYQNIQAGEVVRGGSTITEQYVKNAYFSGKPRTILQKVTEMVGAIIIESKYSKDEILRKYLSTVYMGNNLYGIENVLEENPNDDNILDIITKLRYPNITISNKVTIQDYRTRLSEKLSKKPTRIEIKEPSSKKTINIFPSITKRVDTEVFRYCTGKENTLEQWTMEIPKNLCETSEKKLTLTIDSNLMQATQNIAKGILDTLVQKNVTNGSVYILNPTTRKILTYIGSVNSNEEIDMITKSRSVGSILKPFIYLFALQEGADSEDYLLDDKTAYETEVEGKYFIPENYNPKSYGPIRLREALGNSLNAATVRLTEYIGITKIYNKLRGIGLKLDHDVGYYGYGISLGTVETSMENIVQLYSQLLNYSDPNIWQIGN